MDFMIGMQMKDHVKIRDQLVRELEEARKALDQLSACQTELQKAQERYQTLLESGPDPMAFISREGKIVMVNAQLEVLFGYTREDLIGRNIDTLVPERFRGTHAQQVKEYFLHPRARPMGSGLDIYALKKDGTEFAADVSLSTMRAGEDVFAVAAIRDVTVLKRSEAQFRQNYHMQKVMCSILKSSLEPISLEKQLDRIIEQILSIPWLSLTSMGAIYLVEDEPDVLVMKTQRGFPESQRKICEKVPFGRCLCGQAACSCKVIYAESIDDRHETRTGDMLPHGHYCIPVVYNLRTLGLINVFVKEGHKRIKEEEDFLTAVANTLAGIIVRYRAQMEKEHLQEKLAQAEKLSAIGRLTQNIAHEIRNPLTSVGGFVRRLEREVADGTKAKEYAGLILSDVGRLEIILKNVLTFSSEEKPRLEEHDIHVVIDKALSTYDQILRERSIRVRRSYGDLSGIQLDQGQVQEAIENIISNAIHAMPGGGTLTIQTARELVRDDPYITVKITDTGEGIPQDRLGMIFEPFSTADETGIVTKLGLPISRKIIEDHGGFITVESGLGKGAAFSLYFPQKPRADNRLP